MAIEPDRRNIEKKILSMNPPKKKNGAMCSEIVEKNKSADVRNTFFPV